jgi:hypothetical protein
MVDKKQGEAIRRLDSDMKWRPYNNGIFPLAAGS